MKYICKSCEFVAPCVLDIGDDIELQPTCFVCPKKPRNENCKWEILPKLTAEVFDREDCPPWAKYASVNKDGFVIFYEEETSPGAKKDIGIFDNSDWQNSLIKRPEKKNLPEWVEAGKWAFHDGRYGEIIGINHTDGKIDIGETGHFIPVAECAEARLRPYNDEEMKALVGKIAQGDNGTIALIIGYRARDKRVLFGNLSFTSDDLYRCKYIIDGEPSYVLEHFDPEREEWVK